MKKMLFLLMLGVLLLPFKVSADAESVTFDLPAPKHLHVVDQGSDWVQLAWNPVPGAESYRVITREVASGNVVSVLDIDIPQITISNLQESDYWITVGGIRNNVVGQVSGISVTLPLVFDLVLGKDEDGSFSRPNTSCPVICSFASENPEATLFNCQNSNFNTEPFFIQATSSDPSLGSIFLYVYYVAKEPGPGYDIYIDEKYAEVNDWRLYTSRAFENRDVLFLEPNSGLLPPVRIEFFEVSLKILLPEGYQITIYEDCGPPPGVVSGLSRQQNNSPIDEAQTIYGTTSADATEAVGLATKNHGAFRVVNPVKDELVLNFEKPTGQAAVLELFSMNGAIAAREQLPEGINSFRLPASYLAPGTYLLRVYQEAGIETRLIIKH